MKKEISLIISWILTLLIYSKASSQITLPFNESFESASPSLSFTTSQVDINGLSGNGFSWSYEKNNAGRLRLNTGNSFCKTGIRAATLDVSNTSSAINYLILNLDMSNYANSRNLTLSFSFMRHSNVTNANGRVWVRGNNAANWIEISNLDLNPSVIGTWQNIINVDIDSALTSGGQQPSNTFQLRFGQEGRDQTLTTTSNGGITFDDIKVNGTIPFPIDLAINRFTSSCDTIGQKVVTVVIDNLGFTNVPSTQLVLSVNGVIIATENYTTNIPAYSSVNYSFNTRVNFTNINAYDVKVWLVLNNDAYHSNDTASTSFIALKPPGIFYVNSAATGLNNGTSWENASTTLQASLYCECTKEIWIAKGTYKPTNDNNRNATFNLPKKIKIYGGFNGTENSLSQRILNDNNRTIISGDIGVVNNNSDNVYRIISCIGNNGFDVLLDGLTITEGAASGTNKVAGIYINLFGGEQTYLNKIIINKCTISNNQGTGLLFSRNAGYINLAAPMTLNIQETNFLSNIGGGIINECTGGYSEAILTIDKCVFSNNSNSALRQRDIPPRGGAANVAPLMTTIINNCIFNGNNSTHGGAINDSISDGVFAKLNVNNCQFRGNNASVSGGAIYSKYLHNRTEQIFFGFPSEISFVNCLFSGNKAQNGGAIYNQSHDFNGVYRIASYHDVNPIFINTTFSGNNAVNGGAIYNIGNTRVPCNPILKNCVLWGNSSNILNGGFATPSVTDCLIQGGYFGGNNITTVNPDFITPISFNSAPTIEGDYHLSCNSPAKNIGVNAHFPSSIYTDVAGEKRILQGRIDLGAYELTKGITITSNGKGIDSIRICYSDSVTLSIANSNLSRNFQWYKDGNLLSNRDIFINTKESGIYAVRLLDSTSCVSERVDSVVVIRLPDIKINRITPEVSCDRTNNQLDFRVTTIGGIGNGYTYTWQDSLGTFTTGRDPSINLTPRAGSNNKRKIFVTDSYGCSQSDTFFTYVTRRISEPYYVNSNVNSVYNDGLSWATAFKSLSPALSLNGCTDGKDIWVAKGIYKPTHNSSQDAYFNPSNNRIYGGFSGNEIILSQRSIENNLTVLSGEIGDSNSIFDNSTTLLNSFNSTINGFTLTGVKTNIISMSTGNNIIENCKIINNTGAITTSGGSGISCTIKNCIFAGNNSYYMINARNLNNDIKLINTIISGNSIYAGIAMIYVEYGFVNLYNCTITGNKLLGTLIDVSRASNSQMINSIIWGNSWNTFGSSISISNSIVEGGYNGTNIINTNPNFIMPINFNNAPFTNGNFKLRCNSPAINYGNNNIVNTNQYTLDIAGRNRVVNSIVDLGAYEYQFPPMTITDTIVNVTATSSLGKISLGVRGGNPPYQFLWSSGDTSSVLRNVVTGTYSVTITDKDSCQQTKIFRIIHTSNHDLEFNAIQVYPNPTSGYFTLELENMQQLLGVKVTIVNTLGQIIKTQDLKDNKTILDLSAQPQGTYFIKLRTSDGLESVRKITKM